MRIIRKTAFGAALCLLAVSLVLVGINNSAAEGTAVTAIETKAQAGTTLTKNTSASPASDFTYTTTGGSSVTITGYIGSSSQVIIPDTINSQAVTAVGDKAFGETHEITYLYLPASVEQIASNAFFRCDGLFEIDVSEDNQSFSCKDGVLYNKDKTTLLAFPGAVGGEFLVPRSVTKINDYAFCYCYELTKINMYNNVTEIGDFAFAYCWSLKNLRLSDNLTLIGKEALAHNLTLASIYLPKNVIDIGENALLGAQSSPGYYEYYFVDGIYCVAGSYSHDYVLSLGLNPMATADLRFDLDTGVYATSVFALGTNFNARSITSGLTFDAVADLVINDNYYDFWVYELGAKLNGTDYPLSDGADIYIPAGSFPDLLKAYRLENGQLVSLNADIVSPFSDGKKYIRFSSDSLGTFVIAEYYNYLKGDINADGKVRIDDARLALRSAVGLQTLHPAQISAADFINVSGKIELPEVRKILRVAVGLEKFD